MKTNNFEIGAAVVFDDHKLFASTFSMLLERTGFFTAVHNYSEEKDLLGLVCSNIKGKVFLFLDFYLPGNSAMRLIADIRRFNNNVHIIIVSSLTNTLLIRRLLEVNLDGFLSKSGPTEEVIMCINAVVDKKLFISPYIIELLEKEEKQLYKFTTRELEILENIGRGASTTQIAQDLNITSSTVLTHRKNMLAKTSYKSITELLSYAIRVGLISV